MRECGGESTQVNPRESTPVGLDLPEHRLTVTTEFLGLHRFEDNYTATALDLAARPPFDRVGRRLSGCDPPARPRCAAGTRTDRRDFHPWGEVLDDFQFTRAIAMAAALEQAATVPRNDPRLFAGVHAQLLHYATTAGWRAGWPTITGSTSGETRTTSAEAKRAWISVSPKRPPLSGRKSMTWV